MSNREKEYVCKDLTVKGKSVKGEMCNGNKNIKMIERQDIKRQASQKITELTERRARATTKDERKKIDKEFKQLNAIIKKKVEIPEQMEKLGCGAITIRKNPSKICRKIPILSAEGKETNQKIDAEAYTHQYSDECRKLKPIKSKKALDSGKNFNISFCSTLSGLETHTKQGTEIPKRIPKAKRRKVRDIRII